MGLVSQIFTGGVLHGLVGDMAIGHTRYSTTGTSNLQNAQPLTGNCLYGQVAIAHNGNLTNASQLREELEFKGQVFQTTVDSEVILYLLAQPTLAGNENNLVQTVRCVEGAYSLVIMTEQELIGVRDPYGFRPLSIGRVGDGWVLASETCAFDLIHAKFVRDVEPGEIVIINKEGLKSVQAFPEQTQRAFCIFEYVYFARPDSSRANVPSTPTSSFPCPTAATAPPWAIPSNRAFPSRWPSCEIIMSAAASCNQPSSSATSMSG
jgi:amidophosphoribosyltransferase